MNELPNTDEFMTFHRVLLIHHLNASLFFCFPFQEIWKKGSGDNIFLIESRREKYGNESVNNTVLRYMDREDQMPIITVNARLTGSVTLTSQVRSIIRDKYPRKNFQFPWKKKSTNEDHILEEYAWLSCYTVPRLADGKCEAGAVCFIPGFLKSGIQSILWENTLPQNESDAPTYLCVWPMVDEVLFKCALTDGFGTLNVRNWN